MLGDAAGFARNDIGLANGVEQRGLAVIDMAHDGDDGRTRHEVFLGVGLVEQALLDVGFGDALDAVAEFDGDQFGGVGVDHIGDLEHLPLFHQQLDHVHAAFRHAVGEFLDGDGLGQHDFAGQALLLLHHALEALGAAAEGRDRTHALLVAALGGGAGHGQAAAILHRAGAARLDGGNREFRRGDDAAGRRRRGRRPRRALGRGLSRRRRRGRPRGVEDDLLRPARRPCIGGQGHAALAIGGGGGGAGGRETAARLFFGAALGFGLAGQPGFLVLPAVFGGVAFGAFARLPLGAQAGVGLLALAVILFADAGVAERAGAGVALVVGQGAQYHAGLRARRERLHRPTIGGLRPLRRGRRRGGRRRRLGSGMDRLAGAMGAALDLLHHHGLRAAMRKTLAYDALFDRTLERKRLGRRRGQSLVAGIVGVIHIVHTSQGLGRSCRRR